MLWFGKKKHKQVKNFTPFRVKGSLTKRTIAVRLFAVVMLVALGAYYFLWPHTIEAGWYDGTWGFRKKIVINNAQVSGSSDFTNFPVLIQIRDSDLKHSAQSSGNDILFTSADGKTKIDHEIEEYNSLTGELTAWVEIPTLGGATDTTIYMYYGNKAASNQANPTGVWDSNYQAVWHSKETSGSRTDSTANAYTLSDTGGVTSARKHANASRYQSASFQRLSIADASAPNLNITGNLTIETWVNLDAVGATTQALVSKDGTAGQQGYFLRYNLNGKFNFILSSNGSVQTSVNGTTVAEAGTWYHVVGVYNGTDMRIYVNGVLDTSPVSYTGGIFNNNNAAMLGSRAGGVSQNLDGNLDESRISNTERSADWIATEYNNMSSPSTFYTINDQEKGPVILSWKFDELQGTSANDSSGNGNTGTIAGGPTWVDSSLCVSGGCLKFTAGNVSRTYNADTELAPESSSFSTSIWFKHNATAPSGNPQSLITRYNQTGYRVYMTTTGAMCFAIDDDNTWEPDDSACSTATYLDNKWHYVHAVKTDTSSIALYIDGEQVAIDASISATGSLSGSSTATYVGSDGAGGFDTWIGFLDDFKVYNNAPTSAQIKTYYLSKGTINGVSTNIGGNKNSSFPTSPLSNSLVGYWKMDESTANTCTGGTNDSCDSSGNDFDGAWNGDATTTATARFNRATTYDGTGDYTQISDNALLRPNGGPYTVSFWANPANTDQFSPLFTKEQSTGDLEQLDIEVCGNTNCSATGQNLNVWFRQNDANERRFFSAADVADGNWHMYTVVIDSETQTLRVYVDGVQLTAASTITDGAWPVVDNSDPIRFGADGSGNYYNGQIDEARIYNKALKPDEVRQIYTSTAGPIGYWKMDERTGTTVYDSSGNGYSGTIQNGGTFSSGKYGSALNLNGTSQYVVVNPQSGLNNTAGTLEAWVNPSSTPASDQFIVMGNRDSNHIYMLRLATTGNLGLRVGTLAVTDTGVAIPANTWTHVAVSYNNGTYYAYVKGRLVASNTYTGLVTLNGYSTIGAYDDLAGNVNSWFPGKIDEVKMYAYTRTEKEITEDMNAGHPPPDSPAGSALAYWKFDEGKGTTANNSGNQGSTLNGTLTNMAAPPTTDSGWTNSGKYNRGIKLDGTNDYVSIGNQTAIQTFNTLTISGWIKADSFATGNLNVIFYKDTSGFYFGVNDSKLRFRSSDLTSDTTETTTNLSTGVWTYVAATYDGSTVRLFVNGREEASEAATGTISENTVTATIGSFGASSNFFDGTIDELKIYNGALTAQQIQLDYNQSKATVIGSISTESDGKTPSFNQDREYCVPGDTSTCLPPVAEYKLDERTGTTAFDTSGKNNNGTLTNSPTWSRGKIGQGVQFNGTNQYIALPNNNSAIQNTNSISVEAWVYPAATVSSTQYIISYSINGSTTTERMSLRLAATNAIQCEIFMPDGGTSVNNSVSNVITPNAWNHVACVFSYSNSRMLLMVNGQTVNYPSKVYSQGTTSNTTSDRSAIGARPDGGGSYFAGIIDDVRVYGYERSADQIIWDYSKGKPRFHMKMDECTGTTINDSSGNGYSGTLNIGGGGTQTAAGTCYTSGAWFNGATGKFNSAISLDGVDDNITTAAQAIIAIDGTSTSNGSWGGWFYPTGSAASKTMIHRNNEMQLFTDSSSRPTCKAESSATTAVGTTALPLNTWTNLYCTYDGTNLKLFVNSREITSVSLTPGQFDSTNLVTYIGSTASSTQYFSGLVDDVRIYTTLLNSTQLKLIMNESSAVRFGP